MKQRNLKDEIAMFIAVMNGTTFADNKSYSEKLRGMLVEFAQHCIDQGWSDHEKEWKHELEEAETIAWNDAIKVATSVTGCEVDRQAIYSMLKDK